MVAPAVAAALPVVMQGAKRTGKTVMDVMTSDLAVIRTETTRGRGKNKKPVELEFHVNPAALGLTAVGAGLALWLAQLRLQPVVDSTGKVTTLTLASRAGFGMGETIDTASYVSPIISPVDTAIVASPIGIFLRWLGVV